MGLPGGGRHRNRVHNRALSVIDAARKRRSAFWQWRRHFCVFLTGFLGRGGLEGRLYLFHVLWCCWGA